MNIIEDVQACFVVALAFLFLIAWEHPHDPRHH